MRARSFHNIEAARTRTCKFYFKILDCNFLLWHQFFNLLWSLTPLLEHGNLQQNHLLPISLAESSIETSQSKSNRAINHFNAARIQALTLAEGLQTLASMEKDIAVKIAATQSHIGEKTVLKYMRTARIRGYDPTVSTIMKEEYVTDAPRSGRPPKATPEVEA